MHLLSWFWPRRWHWRIALLVALLTLVAAVSVPALLRYEITRRLSAATPATVQLTRATFNPLLSRLTVSGLALTLPGEPLPVLTVAHMAGEASLLSLLFSEMSIARLTASGVRLAAVHTPDGRLNLADLLRPTPPDAPVSELPTLTVEQIHISDVQCDYVDLTRARAARVSLSLHDLTTEILRLQADGLAAPVAVRSNGNLSTETAYAGAFVAETAFLWRRSEAEITATVSFTQLSLALLEPYLRDSFAVQNLTGGADARFQYHWRSGGSQPPVHLLSGAVTATDLSFVERSSGQEALHAEEGRMVIERVDWLQREIRLAAAELRDPRVRLLATPAGLNWDLLMQPTQTADLSPQRSRATAGASRTAEVPSATPSWRFSLLGLKTQGGEFTYRDEDWPKAEAVRVTLQDGTLGEIGDGVAASPFRLTFQADPGRCENSGTLRFAPFRLDLHSRLSKVAVASFSPVLSRLLQIKKIAGEVNGTVQTGFTGGPAGLRVNISGSLDAPGFVVDGLPDVGEAVTWETAAIELREGSTLIPLSLDATAHFAHLTLKHLPQGDVSIEKIGGAFQFARHQGVLPPAPPQQGKAALADAEGVEIEAQGTLEAQGVLFAYGTEKQELLSCHAMKARLKPGSRLLPFDIQLAEAILEYPYAQGFRASDGRFQFTKPPAASLPVLKTSEKESEPPATTLPALVATPLLVHLERATVIGGQFYFEDRAVTPAQTIYWQDIRVDLADVAYPLTRPAVFALHAFNMDGAPIEVSGNTERQGDQLVTRVHGAIENLHLAKFNSYLAPLLGYRVKKGAVSVKWDLLVPGDTVQADADVTLHDLGLSGKLSASEVEQQVGLPMHLVLALLKDINGDINLQVPMTGNLNQSGVQVGSSFWRAFRDVVIGAVTSPLKLLGAIFSEKERLDDFFLEPIPFEAGTSQLTVTGKEQVSRLRNFLAQRPELDLQLSCTLGQEDRHAMRDRVLFAALPKTEGAAGPEGEVSAFLHYAVQHDGSPPPPLSLPAATLLQSWREKTEIPAADLTALADERLRAVRTLLTDGAGIPPERISLAPDDLRGRTSAEVRYMIRARGEKKAR